MSEKNELLEQVTGVVSEQIKAATDNLTSKEELAELTAKKDQLIESLKSELESNKENIKKLDEALKNQNKSSLKQEEINANTIAKHLVSQIFDQDGEVKKTKATLKALDLCSTIGGYTDDAGNVVPGVDAGTLNLWTQIVGPASTRKRLSAEWYNNFPSIRLNSNQLGKFAFKDNATLAQKVDECELKPSNRIDIEYYSRKACKVAETFCFSDEYLMSAGNFFDQIVNVLSNRILRSVPAQFINELVAQGSDYQNTLGVTLPAGSNAYDAMYQVVTEMKCQNACTIDQIHATCEVIAELENIKDANGNYIFKCGCNDSGIFGRSIELIENNDLPDSDGILFLDSSVVTKAEMDGLMLEEITGEESRKRNKRTWLAEVFFGAVVHPCDIECVKYDTLSDIKTSLGL